MSGRAEAVERMQLVLLCMHDCSAQDKEVVTMCVISFLLEYCVGCHSMPNMSRHRGKAFIVALRKSQWSLQLVNPSCFHIMLAPNVKLQSKHILYELNNLCLAHKDRLHTLLLGFFREFVLRLHCCATPYQCHHSKHF